MSSLTPAPRKFRFSFLGWLCLFAAGALAAQSSTSHHEVHTPVAPNLYDASFSGCGIVPGACSEAFEDKFQVNPMPAVCCTLLVTNGDGFSGADAVLAYDIYLNGKKVIFSRGDRANLKRHVNLRRNNTVKVTLSGETFRRMSVTISPDPPTSN